MTNNYDIPTTLAIAIGIHDYYSTFHIIRMYPELLNAPNHADMGRTPFFIASRFHDPSHEYSIKIFEFFLESGLDINTQDRMGNTILHEAVLYNPKAIQFILEKGADINSQNNYGSTPLHLCLESNKITINEVNIILNHGADPNIRDDIGWTPFHKSIILGKNFDIFQAMLNSKDNFAQLTLPHEEIRPNSIISKTIKREQQTPEEYSNHLKSLLFATDVAAYFLPATNSDKSKFLDAMLSKNIGSVIRDSIGGTVLHYASAYGQTEIIKSLVNKHKFPIDIQNNLGQSPLHAAILAGQAKVISTLLDMGANAFKEDNYHNTPLDYADFVSIKEISQEILSRNYCNENSYIEKKIKQDYLIHTIMKNICNSQESEYKQMLGKIGGEALNVADKFIKDFAPPKFQPHLQEFIKSANLKVDFNVVNSTRLCKMVEETAENFMLRKSYQYIYGADPEQCHDFKNITIINQYGIERNICWRDLNFIESIFYGIAELLAKNVQPITQLATVSTIGIISSSALYHSLGSIAQGNYDLMYIGKKIILPIGFATLGYSLGLLSYDPAEYYFSRESEKINKEVGKAQLELNKIISYQPESKFYLAESPALCKPPFELLKNNIDSITNKTYQLCWRYQPSNLADEVKSSIFDVIENIIKIPFPIITIGLTTTYWGKIPSYLWNIWEHVSSSKGFIIGLTSNSIYQIFRASKKANEDPATLLSKQQLEANKFINEHTDKDYYLVQKPGECGEGDKVTKSFDSWWYKTSSWLVCEKNAETSQNVEPIGKEESLGEVI